MERNQGKTKPGRRVRGNYGKGGRSLAKDDWEKNGLASGVKKGKLGSPATKGKSGET